MAQLESGGMMRRGPSSARSGARVRAYSAESVGMEEALRMEADALAKLQKSKAKGAVSQHGGQAEAKSAGSRREAPASGASGPARSQLDSDLISFPEGDLERRRQQKAAEAKDLADLELLLLVNGTGTGTSTITPAQPAPVVSPALPTVSGRAPSTPLPSFSPLSAPSHAVLQTQMLPLSRSLPQSQTLPPNHLMGALPFAAAQQQISLCPSGYSQPMAGFAKDSNLSRNHTVAAVSYSYPQLQAAFPQWGTAGSLAAFPMHRPVVGFTPPGAGYTHAAHTAEWAEVYNKIATIKKTRQSESQGSGQKSPSDFEALDLNPVSLKSPETPRSGGCDWLDLDPIGKLPQTVGESAKMNGGVKDVQSRTGAIAAGAAAPDKDPWDAVLLQPQSQAGSQKSVTEADGNSDGNRLSGPVEGRPMSPAASRPLSRTLSDEAPSESGSRGKSNISSKCSNLGDGSSEDALFKSSDRKNEEVASFCDMITKLREEHPHMSCSNLGFVLSPVLLERDLSKENVSVKVTIEMEGLQQPVTFTCDVSSPVELIVIQALCCTHDDLGKVVTSDYVLRVCGREEVLQSRQCLGSHEHIHLCRKFDTDIRLQLLHVSAMRHDLARTSEDDADPTDLQQHLHLYSHPLKHTVSRKGLSQLMDAYHNELDIFLQTKWEQHRGMERVAHATKAVCSALSHIETPAVTEAVQALRHAANRPRHTTIEATGATASERLSVENKRSHTLPGKQDARRAGSSGEVETQAERLTAALYELVELYCAAFDADFLPGATEGIVARDAAVREAPGVTDTLRFTLHAAHHVPASWITSYEKYNIVCSLTHGGRSILQPYKCQSGRMYKSFFHQIRWNDQVNLPVQVSQLPRETVLRVTLQGVPQPSASGGSPDSSKQRRSPEPLGWATIPLFNFRQVLTSGTKLLCLGPPSQATYAASCSAAHLLQPDSVILQLDFPPTKLDIIFPTPMARGLWLQYNFEDMDPDTRKSLQVIMSKDSVLGLGEDDKVLLWEKRHHLHAQANALPWLLASAPGWQCSALPDIYALLGHWPALSPVHALMLLHSNFADQEVRRTAVEWIACVSDDELADYLPQLLQALKHECYLDNALMRFLLGRSMSNIRIAHYLYWLLKDTLEDGHFGGRSHRVLGALLCCCGRTLRHDLESQTRLVHTLATVAEKVRQATGSTRQAMLQEGMEKVQQTCFRNAGSSRLPICPSLAIRGVNQKACSFFNSNAVPLKVSFLNADPSGEDIQIMFKVGDDLRQDMLTLQMIKIMDKIWLQEGLDMRMVLFKCISTGKERGMVELVLASDTLRKIQVEHGVTGSFKDKPLAEWLQKHNPTEQEYEKAVENFIYSCAGCCVATYVLGICDRHNDNIMLRTTGHMFHIDFGKFLGHAQMFGNIKRDRAPFVLTSDMAYVINGGERPTSRFQHFVDLCCQAYNLIRKHTNLFLNLLGLMMSSGIPELADVQDLKYVYEALMPQATDTEATAQFTRLIESSLGSMATKVNFFIHNLAQRFSGPQTSNEEPTLSFNSKQHSLRTDGRICEASVYAYQKRYNPEKYYIYVVKVVREVMPVPTFILRTFAEFQELHNKLCMLFSSLLLPSFPNKLILGRTHVEEVASRRKTDLHNYLQELVQCKADITECDLLYTFFHPILRDEKVKEEVTRLNEPFPQTLTAEKVGGKVKLSVSYRNAALFIMVMHIKDLVFTDGADPDPYVKTYLLPDPNRVTKRKTKIARKTLNPTYNEMLVYNCFSKEALKQRRLQLSVWSAEALRENIFLGGLSLSLRELDLDHETVGWFPLQGSLGE
ncbi:phosphatidylinositol 4-phosphate 3-kinase C2 domain-containing subunit alpha-like isoform X2 [Lampetra fluviatilis]